jgi:hypothetical protein
MKTTNEYLTSNEKIGSVLYYPGGGTDFKTLKLFVEKTSINQVYYSDYSANKLDIANLVSKLGEDWTLIHQSDLIPKDFNQNKWSDFWYNLESAVKHGQPENAYALKLNFKNDVLGKEFVLYYLGTEAIKTYHILLNNDIKLDVIVLQDHGTGGNWSKFGIGGDEKMYGLGKASANLPSLLFVGKKTDPWYDYIQITPFEGEYGSAGHPRALFQKV